MPILVQYLHVIGSFQGILLAGLLIFGSQNTNASRILGTWCLFLALSFLAPFISMGGELNIFTSLIGFNSFLPAAYGAFLYLYCRHAIVDSPVVMKDLWHFLPIVTCYLINIEVFTASPEIKLDLVTGGGTFSNRIMIAQLILFSQAFIYFGVSGALIHRYQIAAKSRLSNFNPDIFSWLWKLLILDFIIWCLKAATHLFGADVLFSVFSDGLILLLIYSIAMAQWRNPALFKIEQFSGELNKIKLKKSDAQSNSQIKPKNSGALDPEIRSSLLEAVQKHMTEQQTYLDNKLTLPRLADAVGVSNHHLSEVLNQHEGKNFYAFVNNYRINYVCERMKQDQTIKILDLAMTAGFSSKSTFNAVFKQFTNLTPSQYRSQLS